MFLKKAQHLRVPEIIDLSLLSGIFLSLTSDVSGRKVQTDENTLLYLKNPKERPAFASTTLFHLQKNSQDHKLVNVLAQKTRKWKPNCKTTGKYCL